MTPGAGTPVRQPVGLVKTSEPKAARSGGGRLAQVGQAEDVLHACGAWRSGCTAWPCVEPGSMNGEMASSPTRPPPGTAHAGHGVLDARGADARGFVAAGRVVLRAAEASASSKVMSRSPSFLYAGDPRIFGTHASRKVLMPA